MYKISKTCGITIYIFTFYKKDFIEKNYVFCGGDSKTLTKLFPGIWKVVHLQTTNTDRPNQWNIAF